jgi:hypothetical protein
VGTRVTFEVGEKTGVGGGMNWDMEEGEGRTRGGNGH